MAEPIVFVRKIKPSQNTRLGRMLAAGKLTATLRSKQSGEHITVSFNSKLKTDRGWEKSEFMEASHVFINHGDFQKVGTYYPKTGKLYMQSGRYDTPAYRYVVTQILNAAMSGVLEDHRHDIKESEQCGRCGRQLTDPVSIERGIGPECYGKLTGSVHHRDTAEDWKPEDPVTDNQVKVAQSVLKTNDVMNAVLGGPTRAEAQAIVDRKGRTVPKTFEALVAAAKK